MKYFEGFHLNGWFGNIDIWIEIAGIWILAMIFVALTFGAIARIGK